MLVEGLAWYPTTYAHEDGPETRQNHEQAQVRAKAARTGLWAEPNPMEPRECRRARERGQKCR